MVLTDLKDYYCFFWLNNRTLYNHVAMRGNVPDRGVAWGFFDSVLNAEVLNEDGDIITRTDWTEAPLPPTAKRQRLQFSTATGQDVADVMELEGFLEPVEWRSAAAMQLLQEFMRIPAVAAATADTSDLHYRSLHS